MKPTKYQANMYVELHAFVNWPVNPPTNAYKPNVKKINARISHPGLHVHFADAAFGIFKTPQTC
jgi:hypothetical protein